MTFNPTQYSPYDFANLRHIGPSKSEIADMCKVLGVKDIDELIDQTVPENIRQKTPLYFGEPKSEQDLLKYMRDVASKNKVMTTMLGQGYHDTVTPPAIQRNVFENPAWYTAYTPYQPEISQGRLEALLNYQTMICDLTGLEVANASLLDEATAAAEAMTMAERISKSKKKSFFIDENCHPQNIAVMQTRAMPLGIDITVGNPEELKADNHFGAIFQYPGTFGELTDFSKKISELHEAKAIAIMIADPLALTLLKEPGEMGADIAVGSTQRFGVPMGFGGPSAAYMSCKDSYKRSMPGRIVGVSIDTRGTKAYRLSLQTREQHIKRDRATSNICTAQVLLAVMAGMYAIYHGPKGLQFIAKKIHQKTSSLDEKLTDLGLTQKNKFFFDTLSIEADSIAIKKIAEKKEINFYYPHKNRVCISINETTSSLELDQIIGVFLEYLKKGDLPVSDEKAFIKLPKEGVRKSLFLTNPVFNSYHSETALMRYIKSLERKDLALNHSMISLGSCTMKLNAASEMLPLSDPNWGAIHPFVPIDQANGYQKMLSELTEQLNVITGFAATSLQPNSGAQGEYSGLMTIRAYHESRNDFNRNICIIPASAHGTNPASAVMAGMTVVVTGTDKKGNIDWDDIQEKALFYKDKLSALMITYPSTHGVFETRIKEITQLIHDCGGQVYMDGANMNAQVGLTSPAIIGADVCHLNLHKTFAIPHGGGGPGVGPICVVDHLAPFLPGNPIIKTGGKDAITAISGAPFGSALACLISYGYIKMLGGPGLRKTTEIAILNANYIQKRLEGAYDVLYTGIKGRAAHEFIIDCRPFKEIGIEVVDIAKRLMDYGFHAPTVSFPVPGTMMIEPTESENIHEMDRFCDAMISIRMEISGSKKEHALLKNAPHTLAMISADKWNFSYSRQKAAFPLEFVKENKFWPSVRRVDEAYGDRNLICSCKPIELYVNN